MAVIDAFSAEKNSATQRNAEKMAKHGVEWHFSALQQYRARFFTRDISPNDLVK
jgi:hypothetical protein